MSNKGSSGKRVSPFVQKLHQMVTSHATNHAIFWNSDAPSFTVLKQRIESVLPHYFRHANFSSFVRQLASYGFQRIKNETEQCQFAHQFFQKGDNTSLHLIRSTANPSRTAEARQKAAEIKKLQQNVEELAEVNDNIERSQNQMMCSFASFIYQNQDDLNEAATASQSHFVPMAFPLSSHTDSFVPEACEMDDLSNKRNRAEISPSVFEKLSPDGETSQDSAFGEVIQRLKHLVVFECPKKEAARRQKLEEQRQQQEEQRRRQSTKQLNEYVISQQQFEYIPEVCSSPISPPLSSDCSSPIFSCTSGSDMSEYETGDVDKMILNANDPRDCLQPQPIFNKGGVIMRYVDLEQCVPEVPEGEEVDEIPSDPGKYLDGMKNEIWQQLNTD